MSSTQVTPEVLWAQRSSVDDPEKNYIYLTISVPDVPANALKLDLTPTGLTFTGTSDSKKTTYHLKLEFFDEIDVENSKTHHTARDIELVLRKKELKEEFWPRLLKDKAKVHYLKTDFDKWVDEDEQNEAADDDYMNQFGGGAGAGGMPGMPGMGGMGGMPGMGGDGGFGGIDFSKLGAGAAGLGDLGDEDEEGEEDDEDMPELEEEGSSGAKVQEVTE